MGRILYGNIPQKAFEGNPSSIPDTQSIEYCVKMTLPSGQRSNVTKNMQVIANNSKLDMFDPKRTTLPISMAQFRGYPKPTVTVIEGVAEFTSTNAAINFGLLINNIVGYDITHNDVNFPLNFLVFQGTDTINGVTPTVNIPIGSTSQGATILNFAGSYGTSTTITIRSINNQSLYYLSNSGFDSNGDLVISLSRSNTNVGTFQVYFTTTSTCDITGVSPTPIEFLSAPSSWSIGTIVSSEMNGGYNSAGGAGSLVYFKHNDKRYTIIKEEPCISDSNGAETLPDFEGNCELGSTRKWRWKVNSISNC